MSRWNDGARFFVQLWKLFSSFFLFIVFNRLNEIYKDIQIQIIQKIQDNKNKVIRTQYEAEGLTVTVVLPSNCDA